MRKIIAGLFMSVDGVMDGPENWAPPLIDAEVGGGIGAQAASADTLILGRKSYETFAEAFMGEKKDDPFGIQMTNTPKYVVSTTLDKAEWANTTLISGDFAEQITKLKEQPGSNIAVSGSLSLVEWLTREGLLDELTLWLFPVIVGGGRRLFQDGGGQSPLKLVESNSYSTGVVSLRYEQAAG